MKTRIAGRLETAVGTNFGPLRELTGLDLNLRAPRIASLRYGENPHQSAALYGRHGSGVAGADQLQGKELSYNNLVDLDAAWQIVNALADAGVAMSQLPLTPERVWRRIQELKEEGTWPQ